MTRRLAVLILSLISTAATKNRSVYAEQTTLHINQRAAGIAHVNGCIGLDKIFVIDDAHAAAADSADDPHRHRLPQAERIADRQHNVAGPRFVAIGKVDGRQIILVDFQQRDVRARIGADFFGFEFAQLIA